MGDQVVVQGVAVELRQGLEPHGRQARPRLQVQNHRRVPKGQRQVQEHYLLGVLLRQELQGKGRDVNAGQPAHGTPPGNDVPVPDACP